MPAWRDPYCPQALVDRKCQGHADLAQGKGRLIGPAVKGGLGSQLVALAPTGDPEGDDFPAAAAGVEMLVFVQDEDTSVVWSMPGTVASEGLAHRVIPLPDISGEIVRRVSADADRLKIRRGA